MSDKITVASRAHMAMRITEPMPEEFKDKPGLAPVLRTMTLNGANHEGAMAGAGITRDVDPEMFRLWLEDAKRSGSPLAGLVSEVSEGETGEPKLEYGFEPGLDRMKAQGADMAKGSTVTHEGLVTSTEMAATSDTPNDDTPRGDPDLVPTAHAQTPATEIVAGS